MKWILKSVAFLVVGLAVTSSALAHDRGRSRGYPPSYPGYGPIIVVDPVPGYGSGGHGHSRSWNPYRYRDHYGNWHPYPNHMAIAVMAIAAMAIGGGKRLRRGAGATDGR